MKRIFTGMPLLLCIACAGMLCAVAAATEAVANPCVRIAEPLVKPAFIPLPPGVVEPQGWLRDMALAARDGITGHLDEWHPTFGQGWKGVPIRAPGAEPDGAGWPIEQCSYWLDGLVRLGYALHDDALIQKARARLGLVVEGVNRGGTSFIYWKPGKPSGFNSWAHSQMGRALVAWYQATGEKRILDALVRAYADYPVPMGHLEFNDVSGLCNTDAMLETYAYSNDRRVLERALAALRSARPQETLRHWMKGQFSPGHAVITYENIRLPLLVFPWNQNADDRQATLQACSWIDREHMLPYGVASGEEYMSGIGAFPQDGNVQRGGQHLVHRLDVPHPRPGRIGRRHRTGFLQCGSGPHRPGLQDHVLLPVAEPHPLRQPALRAAQLPRPGRDPL